MISKIIQKVIFSDHKTACSVTDSVFQEIKRFETTYALESDRKVVNITVSNANIIGSLETYSKLMSFSTLSLTNISEDVGIRYNPTRLEN